LVKVRVAIAAVTISAAVGVVFPAVLAIGQAVEGKLFPVVSTLHFLKIEPGPDNSSLVWVRFVKKRECAYRGIGWFWNVDNVLSRVAIDLKPQAGSDPNRPTGPQVAGPWQVSIPPDRLRSESFVTLTHQCHPFYITRTNVYP